MPDSVDLIIDTNILLADLYEDFYKYITEQSDSYCNNPKNPLSKYLVLELRFDTGVGMCECLPTPGVYMDRMGKIHTFSKLNPFDPAKCYWPAMQTLAIHFSEKPPQEMIDKMIDKAKDFAFDAHFKITDIKWAVYTVRVKTEEIEWT